VIVSRVLKCFGLPESAVDEKIRDLFVRMRNPSLALLASATEVKVRITARAGNGQKARAMITGVEKEVRRRLKEHVFAADKETMPEAVGKLLKRKKMTLAMAESCTGGMITEWLTAVPGSSAYLERSFVTYSDLAKEEMLGVHQGTVRKHGAVSRETALQMAYGARVRSGADIGLSVTGIAGPGGGTKMKPVGLVYIGLSTRRGTWALEHRFFGTRETIRQRASQTALDLVRRHLKG
jgi:nicotinamide-nucleotide amidase